MEIESIESAEYNSPEMPLYNFVVDGVHEYFADGMLVHNKTTVQIDNGAIQQLDKALEMVETIQSFEPVAVKGL